MISIRYEPNDLVVRIPKNLAVSDYVQHFLEYLRVESALAKSQTTDAEIESLSEKIKTDWWSSNKERFLRGSSD